MYLESCLTNLPERPPILSVLGAYEQLAITALFVLPVATTGIMYVASTYSLLIASLATMIGGESDKKFFEYVLSSNLNAPPVAKVVYGIPAGFLATSNRSHNAVSIGHSGDG